MSIMRVEQCGISDHHIVLFYLNVDKPRPLCKTINCRQTKNIDIPAFINDINNSGLMKEVSKSAIVLEKVDKFNRFIFMRSPKAKTPFVVLTHIGLI